MTRTAIAAIAALFLAAPAAAQQPSSDAVLPLPRLTGTIQLDGRSDDAAWLAITPLPMTQYLPSFRAPSVERTEVRIGYDANAIYVMVDAWELHPGGVRASSMVRDDDAPGDFINVLLDTFGDRQNAVNFSTTPGGQRNDWTVSNDAQNVASLSPAWNGVWDVVVRRGAGGWHAEYRIPFTTLRFNTVNGRAEFGLHVNRLTAHANERVTFPAVEPTSQLALWKPSRMQRISVEGINAARSLRVMPYVVAGIDGRRSPDPATSPWSRDDRAEIGGDLKTALSPNVTLDLTANTDFAEAEVDDQRVNLTRFPLFYPERRGFFVERAGTFQVRTSETDLLFNSRRVGLTPAGEPVRLLGGARVVGQIAGWDIGLFDAQMDHTDTRARENLGVLRLKRGLINRGSWAGLMVTSRLTSDSSQAAVGADGELYLGGDDYLLLAAATLVGDAGAGADEGVLPRGAARLLVERRRNRGLWYRAGVATTGARYTPALGYVERSDAIRPLLEVGYGKAISSRGHQLRGSASSAAAWRNAAGTFEQANHAVAVTLEQPSGATWTLSLNQQEDELALPFNPVPGTTVAAGRHAARFAQLALTPPNGPRAVAGVSLRAGEFYDGTLYSLTLTPEWRASAHLRLSGELQVDRLEFAGRDERVWSELVRLRALISATPRLSLSTVLQANTTGDLATANLRLRYNVREGHDLWVVYGHHENLDRDRAQPRLPGTARANLLLKYTRSFGQ